MKLDFSDCKTPEDVERVMAKARPALEAPRRLMLGLAHRELVSPPPGCNCFFCVSRRGTD